MSDSHNKLQGLPQTPYMNALSQGAPQMNASHNIIAGPKPGEYWNHSPGLQRPLIREEGPFPVQGNIGGLVAQEGINNFNSCTGGPAISGSPNCTVANTFKPDMFTTADTCGANCTLKYPESFGGKTFGLSNTNSVTNAHALHAYKNERAAVEGRGPSQQYGCYEWIPKLGKTSGDSCMMDQYPAFQQVGDWQQLPQAASIVNYTFQQ